MVLSDNRHFDFISLSIIIVGAPHTGELLNFTLECKDYFEHLHISLGADAQIWQYLAPPEGESQ